MSSLHSVLLAAGGMVFVTALFAAIWASRYVKVGPNRVMIVSGRQHQLADGTRRGFRIVKDGGTFVLPVIEKAEALSLEIFTIEMPKLRVRTAQGAPAEADCLAQVKINGDEPSILAAAEHFLSKSQEEVKHLVRPLVEKYLRTVLGGLNSEESGHGLEACAAKVEAAASPDLGNLGLSLVSITIRSGNVS